MTAEIGILKNQPSDAPQGGSAPDTVGATFGEKKSNCLNTFLGPIWPVVSFVAGRILKLPTYPNPYAS